MLISYVEKDFRKATMDLISVANGIIREYQAQGYSLTLRQLYYQMVARDILQNRQKEYKRLGQIISDARRAGLVDWEAIEDRTRNLRGNTHWDSPEEIVEAAIESYKIDKWENQPYRPEVWIEKDALLGVIASICEQLDVDYFSCRGYTSDSEMWRAGYGRMRRMLDGGQTPVIIHLGDHDPSGVDMTRDIVDRLALFSGYDVEVHRVALNKDQIRMYNPPPNPAKFTDSRATQYVMLHGKMSWELDALEPSVLVGIIEHEVLNLRDDDMWNEKVEEEEAGKKQLKEMIDQ